MMILDKISNFFSKKTITAPIRNKLMMSWSSEENFYKQRREREKLRMYYVDGSLRAIEILGEASEI